MPIRNVADYGAVLTPGIDNAPAIQAVIDMGPGRVIIPELYESGTIFGKRGVEIEGTSREAGIKRLSTLPPAANNIGFSFGDTVSVVDAGVICMQIADFPTSVLIGGSVNAAQLKRLLLKNAQRGIVVRGLYGNNPMQDSIGHTIDDIRLMNISSVNILLYACADINISGVQTDTQRTAIGLQLESGVNSIRVDKYNASGCTHGLMVNDTFGLGNNTMSLPTKPHDLFFSKFLGDSCANNGITLLKGYGMHFLDCWASGNLAEGWSIGDVAGGVTDVEIVAARATLNARNGMNILGNNPIADIRIHGGSFNGNGQSTRNTYYGINLESNVSHCQISQAVCTDRQAIKTQRGAINLWSGNTNCDITDNKVSGNMTSTVTVGGGASGNWIQGNI